MARKLAPLLLALLVALFVWQRRSPEPVPVAIPVPDTKAARAQPLENEPPELAVQPSRAEVLPDAQMQVASTLADEQPNPEVDTRLCVRVLARETHEPCADAWVSATRLPEACDALGRIEFTPHGECSLRAGAPGFLPTYIQGARGHETPETALEIELERAAMLVVVLEDAPKSGFPALTVTRETTSHAYSSSGQAYFDANGRATLDELPPDVALRVRVADGHEAWLELADPVTLRAGETRELRVRLQERCRLLGLALDERGAPVEGLTFWLLPAIHPPRLLVEPLERSQASGSASTDEHGRFVFEGVLPGSWRIAPAVSSRSVDLFVGTHAEIAPVAQPVEILAGVHEQSLEYRVQRGSTISGIVFDVDERPAAGMTVRAQTNPGVELAQCGEDGRFELGPFPAGTYELVAGAFYSPRASLPVRAEAGTRDLVLRLQRLGRIAGQVVDATTRQAVAAQVTLLQPGRARESDPTIFSEPDGSFHFDGLAPGSYALSATPYDGRFAILRGIEIAAGSEASGLRLELVRGARLKLRGRGQLWVEQSGLCVGTYGLEADEEEEISVPAGALRLVLRAAGGGEEARELTLEAGEERALDFR